jgi:hypothetical protein
MSSCFTSLFTSLYFSTSTCECIIFYLAYSSTEMTMPLRARAHECCGLHFMRWGVMPAQTQLTLVIFLWVWLIINSKKNPSFFYFIISIKVFWNILGLGNLKCWSCESFVNWFTIMSDFSLIFGVLWSTSNFGFNFITVKGDGGNGFFPLLLGSMIQR